MGTSRNDPSPNIPAWRPAKAALGRRDLSPERQARLLWQAANAERGPDLAESFAAPVFATACQIAARGASVREALQGFDAAAAQGRAAGPVVDMGRRALARVTAQGGGAAGFARELFAEAAGYYASRDLPSYVGAAQRVQTAAEAIALKGEIRRATVDVVNRAGAPPTDSAAWRGYVGHVVGELSGARKEGQ
jgi:hypothetical protein